MPVSFSPTTPGSPYWSRLVLFFGLLNLLSAAIFIYVHPAKVYDDIFNFPDAQNYASHGLSTQTMLEQRNPPGPGGFVLMSWSIRLTGGDPLRAARLASWTCWLLLITGMLVFSRTSKYRDLWLAALLATMVFPHALLSTGSLLTEGPTLLFGLLGALAWSEYLSRVEVTAGWTALGLLGGFSIGLAVICRQYYVSLLAAAGLLAFALFFRIVGPRVVKPGRVASVLVSLILGVLPTLALAMVWRGLSSPGMASGSSSDGHYVAKLGLNLERPFVAAFYVAMYLFLLSFPVLIKLQSRLRLPAAALSLLLGVVAAHFSHHLLQPGPVNSAFQILEPHPRVFAAAFALLVAVLAYNSFAVLAQLWVRRQAILGNVTIVLALLVVVFFLLEQLGVGGNIPFYDRYVMLIAPFLAIIAFYLSPTLDFARVTVFLALSALSHFMLWRFALHASAT